MKEITLKIPNNKFRFFMELIKNLGFVKVEDQKDATKEPYDPKFVAKIEQSENEFEQGDFTIVEKRDLKNFLDL